MEPSSLPLMPEINFTKCLFCSCNSWWICSGVTDVGIFTSNRRRLLAKKKASNPLNKIAKNIPTILVMNAVLRPPNNTGMLVSMLSVLKLSNPIIMPIKVPSMPRAPINVGAYSRNLLWIFLWSHHQAAQNTKITAQIKMFVTSVESIDWNKCSKSWANIVIPVIITISNAGVKSYIPCKVQGL